MDEGKEKQKYVFISHSNKQPDKEFTDDLYAYLASKKICCWYDAKLQLGDDWREVIFKHLVPACSFILVASENSLKSNEVDREYSLTEQIYEMYEEREKDKKLLLIISLDDCIKGHELGKGGVGYVMGGRLQAVFVNDYPTREEAFQKIVDRLIELGSDGPGILKNNPDDFEYGESVTLLKKYKGEDEFVEIPVYVEEIGDYAFSGCDKVKNIFIPPNVKKIGSCAFMGLDGLEAVEGMTGVEEFRPKAFARTRFIFTESNGYSVGNVVVGGTVDGAELTIKDGAKTIADKAFVLGKFEKLNLCDGLENIGKQAFMGCTKLTEVTVPASVKRIGKGAFEACRGLKKVVFAGKPPENYESAFDDVSRLEITKGEEE